MAADSTKADILRDKILEELGNELSASGDPKALAIKFLDRANDYRTLALMGEMPAHAADAFEAWQSMLPEADTAQLLRLLADVYREAAATVNH